MGVRGRESVVLLRNKDHLLPLTDASGLSTILVTGPTADSLSYQSGGWTFHWQGPLNDDEFPFGSTVLEGIRTQTAKLAGSGAPPDNIHSCPPSLPRAVPNHPSGVSCACAHSTGSSEARVSSNGT